MLALEFSGLNSSFQYCVVVGYGPNKGDGEERDRFWSDMDRIPDDIGIGYRLCSLGDLNGRIEDRTRAA